MLSEDISSITTYRGMIKLFAVIPLILGTLQGM